MSPQKDILPFFGEIYKCGGLCRWSMAGDMMTYGGGA